MASKIIQNEGLHFNKEEEVEDIILGPTNLTEIKKVIGELKNRWSPGIDNVTKKDIEIHFGSIGRKILQLINQVLESGQYPEELKVAKIVPVYKKERCT